MKLEKKELEIPLTEDLMREHGILNRVLLIYEEIIKRICNDELPIHELQQALGIIKSFIEDYHEKLEEDYIFPIFEQHKKELSLIKTLKNQHNKGRKITAKLYEIALSKNSAASKISIKKLLQKFIKMYRPHEAREDTELFPQIRALISKKAFKELSEKFENIEKDHFGKNGFESILKQVENIEKELGIYELSKFTPEINNSKKEK